MTRQLGFSLLALLAISTCSVEAGSVSLTGSIGFTADDITGNTNDITTSTSFQFATGSGSSTQPGTQITTAHPTGSFAGVPAGTVVSSTELDLTAGGGMASPYLTLTLGSDSFTATKFLSSVTPGGNSLVLELSGVIAGTGFAATPADFTLSFTQSGGAGNTITYSGSLSAVPEPSSMILMGMGLIGSVVLGRGRIGRLFGHSA